MEYQPMGGFGLGTSHFEFDLCYGFKISEGGAVSEDE